VSKRMYDYPVLIRNRIKLE